MKKLIGFITIISAVLFLVSCSGKDFTVTFDTDGGSPQVESQKVKKGDYAKLPTEEVKKEGYSFEYWSLDGSEFKFTETKIEKDITIVASWKSNNPGNNDKVTITFNTDGGNLKDPISIDKGTKLPTVTAPTKNGWTFKGWMIGKVDFNLDTLINEDTTLTAKWELIDEGVPPVTGEELTHEFDFSTLTIDGTYVKTETPVSMVNKIGNSPFEFGRLTAQISQPETQYVPEGKTVPVGIVLGLREKNDWSDAYLVSKTAVEGLSKIEIDFTVWGDQGKQNLDYAEGIYIQSSVDGITWVNEANLKDKLVDESYYQGVESFSITEGSKFARIFVKSNGIPSTKFQMRLIVHGIKFYTGNDDVPPVGDAHRVIFDLNYEGSSAPAVKRVVDGNKVVAGPNPTRAGYTFKHWALDNKKFDFNQTITEDVHLKAVWELNEEVPPVEGEEELTHDYDFSGLPTSSDRTNIDTSVNDVNVNNKVSGGDKINFERKNSNILNNSYADITGIALMINETSQYASPYLSTKSAITNLSNIEISYGIWGKQNEQSLDLVKGIYVQTSEDGTNWVTVKDIKPEIQNQGDFKAVTTINIATPKTSYVRIFVEASGTTSAFSFRMIVDKIKFKSIAEPFTGETYTVTFDSKGGNAVPAQSVREGRAATKPSNPRKSGFKFVGWFEEGSSVEFDFSKVITTSITLNASWEESQAGEGFPDDLNEYYEGHGLETMVGQEFRDELKTILYDGVKIAGYGGGLNPALISADKHPTSAGDVYTIYDGAAMSSSASGASGSSVWNKEHVTPKSWYNGKYKSHEGDLHNLRISRASINSDRGNDKFTTGSGNWKAKSNGGFYPGDDHKGDSARIIMYMMVMLPDMITPSVSMAGSNPMQTLINWHNEDPVDSFETRRNDILFGYQKNRNPFIDHPEFVDLIWGDAARTSTITYGHQLDTLLASTTNFINMFEIKEVYVPTVRREF